MNINQFLICNIQIQRINLLVIDFSSATTKFNASGSFPKIHYTKIQDNSDMNNYNLFHTTCSFHLDVSYLPLRL